MSPDISIDFPDAELHPLFYVFVYCAIGLAAAAVSIFTEWLLFSGGLKAGELQAGF